MPSQTSGAPSVSSATTNHRQASNGNPVYYSRSATPASVTGGPSLPRNQSNLGAAAAVDEELGVPLGAASGGYPSDGQYPNNSTIHKPHAVHHPPMASGDSSPVALRETMQGGGGEWDKPRTPNSTTSRRPESTASTTRRSNHVGGAGSGHGSVVAGGGGGITKGSDSSHRGAASSKHDTRSRGGGDAASSHSTTYTGFGGLFDGPPTAQYQQQHQSPPSSQVGGIRPHQQQQRQQQPSDSGGARSTSMHSKYQESTHAPPPQAQPDQRRTGSPGYVDEDNLSHYSSLKVKVVEYLRRTLIPMHRKGKVTRYDMIALCSEVCKEFVEERGLDDATMEGMSTEKLPVEDEMLISSLLLNNMREKQRREAEKEQNSFSDALRDAKQEDARRYQDKLFQENMDRIQEEREALEAARQEFMAQQAHIMEQAKLINERQERVGAGGAPLPEFVPMMTSSTPGKSPPTSRSTAGESAVRPAGGPSSSLVPVPRPPTDSLFQSVTYTISGRIPNAHTHFNPRIGDQHLRVSLNSPAIQESDADIVVSCSVSTRTPVTLTWWLAYGPRTLVLNLDKMYNDRLVTTYQISESSFILTFKQGSLVPGWDYTVCLGVTSVTGSVVSAKTSFKVPPEIGKRDPNEDRSKLKQYVGDKNHYIGYDLVGGGDGFEGPTSPGGNSVASPNPYTGRTQDMYYGDVDINEDEHFQQQRRWDLQLNRSGGGGGHHDDHHGQYDVYDGTGGQEQGYKGVVHGRALDNLGGYQPYVDQQIYRNQRGGDGGGGDPAQGGGGSDGDDPELSGSGYDRSRRRSSRRGRAIRSAGSKTSASDDHSSAPVVYPQGQRPGVRGDLNPFHQPAVGVQSATYQEQLRLFFTDQVQPLYYLSPNPSISEESFNTLVKNIARRYWYAYDRRQEVTDNLKREIIMCVKDEICRYALSTD